MIYVLLAILTSTLLVVNFKMYPRYRVDTFQAIVFNYLTCLIFAYVLVGDLDTIHTIAEKPWLPIAFLLGSTFIFAFHVLAKTVQYIGITVTTIFQKMSMVVTIILAFIIYRESTDLIKMVGITMAFLSILWTYESHKSGQQPHLPNPSYMWALAVFGLSGIIDYTFYYVKKTELVTNDDMLFTGTTFGFAALWGMLIVSYRSIFGDMKITWKNIFAGVLLGIPNVFSVYFILLSLSTGLEGTVIFPILNVGILISSALIGLILFKEYINRRRVTSLVLATLAITLIGISAYVQ